MSRCDWPEAVRQMVLMPDGYIVLSQAENIDMILGASVAMFSFSQHNTR